MAQQGKEIAFGDAVKHFKGVKVQTAKPVKVKGDGGKERDGFEVKAADLAEEHVIGARDYGKTVAIVTIDGQRHETAKSK